MEECSHDSYHVDKDNRIAWIHGYSLDERLTGRRSLAILCSEVLGDVVEFLGGRLFDVVEVGEVVEQRPLRLRLRVRGPAQVQEVLGVVENLRDISVRVLRKTHG